MRDTVVRIAGLGGTLLYGAAIAWMYAAQPQTMAEVTGGLTSTVGVYQIDQQAANDGLAFFARDQFVEARAAFARADPAGRDARIQFYTAYSYYRQGWGRLYNDDALFKSGLEAIDRAIAVAPDHRVVVDDPGLDMHTADELRAELQRGLTRDLSDLNPARLLRKRR